MTKEESVWIQTKLLDLESEIVVTDLRVKSRLRNQREKFDKLSFWVAILGMFQLVLIAFIVVTK